MASTVHIAAAKFVSLGGGPYDLHLLCAKGDLKTIQEFWSRYSDQIKVLSGGYTPLQEAARKGHCSVVDFLLSKGAKVNALSSNGETALYLAAEGRHTDCEVLLMAHGASVNHGATGKKPKDSKDKTLLNILNRKDDNNPIQVKPSLVDRGLASAMRLEHIPYMTKFILLKPTKFEKIIAEAEHTKKHLSAAFLLLVQAAITDDLELVERLYGISKTRNSLPESTTNQMSSIPTTLPLRLAKELNHNQVFELILTRTGLKSRKSAVDISWEGLEISTLSKFILSRIVHVSYWSLSRNCLTSLSFFGVSLDRLCVLDVSHNNIEEIDPAIFDLPQLTSLNLSHNNLSDLPKPNHVGKISLIRLDISQNKFHQVPYSLVYFSCLSYLNLSFNESINCLPDWIAALENLDDLRVEGLPLVYQLRGGFHDTLQTLKLKLDKTMQVYDMKMIVTGSSRNGKSLLINCLRNKTSSATLTPSEGVSIVDWTYCVSSGQCHADYNFSIWEIAGGMNSYESVAIEQLLYTPHAIYVLVFSVLDGVNGVNDLRVWLNAISNYAFPSCVLLVGIDLDQLSKHAHDQVLDEIKQSANSLISNFSNVLIFRNPCFIPVSVSGETSSIQPLRDAIHELATSLVLKDGQPYMGRRVSLSAINLNQKVNTYRHQIWKGECLPVLYQEGMKVLVASLKDTEVINAGELHTLTQFLSSVGSILHYPSISESLSTVYFLDPDWVLQKIRSFFDRLEKYLDSSSSNVKENGNCTRQLLQNLLAKELVMATTDELKENTSCEIHPQIVESFISLLIRYKLLIPVTCDFSQFIVPSLLPLSPPLEEMVSMVTDKYLPIQWKYSLKQPLDRACWLSLLDSALIMERERMTDKSDSLSFSIWKDSIVFKEDGIVVSHSHEIANVMLFSRGYSLQFIELSNIIDKCLPEDVVVSITCPLCLQLKFSKPYEFSSNMCIEAVLNGEENLTCQHLDEGNNHLISITELAPFMVIHPTHKRLTSNDKTTCTGNGVKHACTKLSTLQVLKELNTASLILKDFDCPFITVKQGRLLALAVHKEEKEAIQVFQEPTIGSLADITQGIPRVVLYRIAIQIAKIISSVPGVSANFRNLQLWSVDPECLLHCSLIINHSYELESSGFTEQEMIRKWVFFVKEVTEFASTAAIKFSNGTFTPNYYYLNKLTDECSKKDNTISLKLVISSLSQVLMQLIAGMCPLPDLPPVCGACNVVKSLNVPSDSEVNENVTDTIEHQPMYNEIWIPSLNEETSQLKLNVLKAGCMSLKTIEIHSLKPKKVNAICKCGESVWLSTQLSNNLSCVSIFNINTYNIVHNIKMKENVVTCMDTLENQVFLGTKAGFLFVFPSSIEAIKQEGIKPTHKFISQKELNSLVAMETVLWISSGNCIFLFEWKVFKFKGFLKHNIGDCNIGELVPSQDSEIVYSANLGGNLLSAWSAKEEHMYDINMEEVMSSIGEQEDVFISALNTSRDCVWVGLVTGHLLIFNLQSVLVAWLRPYNYSINYLCFVPDLIMSTSEQHILSCGSGVVIPSFRGNSCESNSKEEVLLLWKSEFAITLKQMKALEENGGSYMNTYNSLNTMIKNYGFKDRILTPKDDVDIKNYIPSIENVTTEYDENATSTLWGVLPFEIRDGETIEIPFDNMPTLEQVQLKILNILSTETTDNIQTIDIHIAYRYNNQDTLVTITSDDDLLCYFELTERPKLLLLDQTFN